MRFDAIGRLVMRFRGPPVVAPVTASITAPVISAVSGPTAESQQAGLDHLTRVAVEQAAARLLGPVADGARAGHAEAVRRTAPNTAVPGDDRDGAPEAYRYS